MPSLTNVSTSESGWSCASYYFGIRSFYGSHHLVRPDLYQKYVLWLLEHCAKEEVSVFFLTCTMKFLFRGKVLIDSGNEGLESCSEEEFSNVSDCSTNH